MQPERNPSRSFGGLGWAACASAVLAGALWLTGCGSPWTPGPNQRGIPKRAYPATARIPDLTVYHGVEVEDPYRWLEDDHAPATLDWVAAQNRLTFAYLEQIPERPRIQARMTRLWNYEKYGLPTRRGGRYFFSKNDGLQNQSVLYTAETLEAEPSVLLDPNRLSPDGTVALSGSALSDDGRFLAYGLASSGSDWQEWRVREVATGLDLADHLRWVKFSGAAWTPDGAGFFYSRYDEPPPEAQRTGVNYFQKLYYHRLGTPQGDDVLVYERPDQKEWGFRGRVTDDGRYLIIHVWQGTHRKNRLFYRDLAVPETKVIELLNDFDASYDFAGNDGPVFWLHTDLAAPRGRVLAIDTRQPDRAHWRELIPQTQDTIQSVHVVGERMIVAYLKDARSQVKQFTLDGRLERELELPGLGSVSGFAGKRTDPETFYHFTSFTVPGRIFRYEVAPGKSSVWREPKVEFDPEAFETHQVFFQSRDGTRVPMFITHRKGLVRDGNQPTLLYGYGGFNISLTPSFSVANLVWLEQGGVYAVANLRGGGEYGEAWHQAGTKLEKQNVFDDFIAAAEWLIAQRYTRPQRLAIAGGSNGGLLVGACMTQRPELFGACLPAVGVMDMLRFHQFTIGWAWTSDYGSAENPDEFRALYAYSPYHNLERGTRYPPTLVTTADHDDRVVPAHSFKFAARLQEYHRGPNPVLIRIETKAGHGAGKPTAKLIEEASDKWAFLVHALRLEVEPSRASEAPPHP
ncbi:MAG: S9 family peptidase [Verrucomicrobia bacterium]|nr:S9 family peptidase [Verrucomicrobiota bacterium]